ncbi:hypothetical protein J1614_001968 [Plenodomus biglobosus]|nr:hypothetical protein J1614_001968 [Plenodomus biglobosus]
MFPTHLSQILHLPILLLLLFLILPPTPPTCLAHPSPLSAPPPCSNPNALQNPSFESSLSPWLDIVTSSFSTRGVFSGGGGGHTGPHFYYARSNSSGEATLTLSQSFVWGELGAGSVGGAKAKGEVEGELEGAADIECSAWISSFRPGNIGFTHVEVFLDGVRCGDVRRLGTSGWTRVGGRVGAGEVGVADGGVHSLAVVIVSYGASEEGWQVWVDDVVVGVAC